MDYRIEAQLSSPATRVLFIHHEQTGRRICLKLWQPCKNDLYDTEDLARCNDYLIEGLEFNRRFAPDVYLGVAPVLREIALQIQCGPLIERPERSKLEAGKRYALVMECLDGHWQLDRNYSEGS